VTTTERDITKDMTAVEAANLLARLEQGHRAAWLSTREAPWHSAEYQARFQNAVEVDGVFRDVMRETVETGMRRPGEPVEEFAERVGSEAWLAGLRKAGLEPHADLIIQQTGADTPPERSGDVEYEGTPRLLNSPDAQAYNRAFSDTAATRVRELRERDPLPEPDRTPGAPHPDPILASRGWHVNEYGIYSRHAEPEPHVPRERELEAGS
jgi:hypothetical protein